MAPKKNKNLVFMRVYGLGHFVIPIAKPPQTIDIVGNIEEVKK